MVVVGSDILGTFDRLEVAEFTAWSLIDTQSIGTPIGMSEEDIRALEKRFLS